MKHTIILIIAIFLVSINTAYLQLDNQWHDFECGTEVPGKESFTSSAFLGGKYKPHRTDIGGAPSGQDRFPVLVVFVQFQNEPGDITNMELNYWRPGYAPNYMNQVIRSRNELTNWWDSYNGYDWSDFWHEYSRGKYHVTGKAVSVILPHDYQWYVNYSGNRLAKINRDTYDALNDPSLEIYWPDFDLWSYNSEGNFTWAPDERVDMLIKVHRHDPNKLLHATASGYIPLGPCDGEVSGEYTVYQSGSTTVRIAGYTGGRGSGGVVCPKAGITSREFWLGVATHELGHYMWGHGHHQYCKVVAGVGGEMGLSPWEVVKMGYVQQKFVNYSTPNNALYDYSSRNGTTGSTGEILQIPISQDGNEFFLIANRRKVSEWDRRMGGDTVAGDFLKNINPEYGKGVYIYHIRNGYNEPGGNRRDHDLECADGLWNWTQEGTASPIWNQTEVHPVFVRTSVGYDQDNPAVENDISKDGISLVKSGYANGVLKTLWGAWYTRGTPHAYTSPPFYGVDRVYTNDELFWYSLEGAGDRWDAWNVGYNEIFSPWSSPNTKDWNNQQTGIYIWHSYINTGNDGALIKTYRVGENGETESSILEKTPPSKPMGVKIQEYYPPNTSICRPMVVWNHNREPDMLRGSSENEKRYRIFKSKRSNMNQLPYQYNLVAEIDLVDNGTDPAFWIDQSEVLYQCAEYDYPPTGTPAPVRYKVQAVDNGPDNNIRFSVLSDFASAIVVSSGGIEPESNDNLSEPGLENSDVPKSFSIGNYPNPFNPVTNIQFNLPYDVFVSIKIYDISGREILTLVNEFRKAGSYISSFDASKLSSGAYFYKIKAGSFESVRKMILLK